MVPLPFPKRPLVPLPKKLFLQLDNSVKDNKNRYVMAFCSLSTTRRNIIINILGGWRPLNIILSI